MPVSPHRRAGALGLALCTLVIGTTACAGGQNVATNFPEVTAGSLPDPDEDTTTTRRGGTTSRGGTTRPGSTTRPSRSTTTRRSGPPSTKKPVNPQFASYCEAFLTRVSAAFSGGGSEAEQLERTKDALADLVDIAPAPIKADMRTFSDYVQTITDPDQMDGSSQPAAVKAADDRLDDWHEANCGT
jgi:hypothetical protein